MVQQCFYHRRYSSTLRVITHPPIQSIRPTSIHLWWDFCNPSPLPRCQQQTAVTCPPPSDGRTTWSWLCCWGRGTSCSPSSASTSTPATTSTGRSCWSTSGVWKLAQFRSLHISVQHPKPFFYIHSFSFICYLLDWAVLQHHRLWIWVYGSGKDWNTESWKRKGDKVLIKVKLVTKSFHKGRGQKVVFCRTGS